MAKGATAKINVVNKISSAFGPDYIGEVNKKFYVWADDGGEKVQIALSLTCPKTFVETSAAAPPSSVPEAAPTMLNFEDDNDITPEEMKNLSDLLEKFNF